MKEEEEPKKEASSEEGNEAEKKEKDASTESSSDDELSKEDIAKIKALFAEQEGEIDELKKKLEKVDKQFKVCRIELTN